MEEGVQHKLPSIVIVGIGGGGSRIVSDGLAKVVEHRDIDRYDCLAKAIRLDSGDPQVYVVDTSADPTRDGFYANIPSEHKISLSSAFRGMSRGAGGRPGRAAKAVLNDEVVKGLADNLYAPIFKNGPAIVVIVHTADGGTGGGLTPEILQHLGYALPLSTVFWVFTIYPKRSALALQGPRTVAPSVGRLLRTARLVSQKDFTQIPNNCRNVIDKAIARKSLDQSYEFQHSRVALFPLSNHHFAQCLESYGQREVREEVLNPFPLEVLSQALYPYLKYALATTPEQAWMQANWPLGPIDIPDIMAGITPIRPIVIPHLYVDPETEDAESVKKVIDDFQSSRIVLSNSNGGALDISKADELSFTGSSTGLHEFRATSVYCIPTYPEGSECFETFGDFVSDVWFPRLSARMKYISGREGIKVGVISHAANLKPQPIPKPNGGAKLGFKNGILTTLVFGAVPEDMPIWLESTREILDLHKSDEFWEIGGYDALDWLKELAYYIGWPDWPGQKYMDLPKDAPE